MPPVSLREVLGALDELNARGVAALGTLVELYHENVVFQDPLQILHGRQAFVEMNERLYARFPSIVFHVAHTAESGDDLFLTWQMTLTPKLGPTLRVPGATHLRVSKGRIISHRDYWDLLGSVMETLPGARRLYKVLLARLG